MRRLALAALLLAACASQRPDPVAAAPVSPPAAAPAPAPSPPPPPAVPVVVPSPPPAVAPAAPVVPPPVSARPGERPVVHTPAPQVLVPPETEGTSRSAFAGCLLAASEAEAARFPPAAPMRSSAPEVTVTSTPGGVLVVHELTHACCLKGAVVSRLEGRVAIVRERLLGSPCRCRCSSTLRTAVSLQPGRWTVAVDVEEAGGLRRVFQQPVDVR